MIRVWLVFLLSLSLASAVSAQNRPGAFSTVVTTNTGVTSLCVGANAINAPSSCTGGLQAGAGVFNSAITLPSFTPSSTTNQLYNVGGNLFWNGLALATGGSVGPGTTNTIPLFTSASTIANSLLTQSGTVVTAAATLASTVFGGSSFTAGGAGDQSLTVRNTTAGVANRGAVFVGNDTAANLGTLVAFSSTFTTSGYDIANGVRVAGTGAGGLILAATNAAGIVRFFAGGTTERGQITAAGLWNWETFGVHQFSAGGTGPNALAVINPTAGAGNYASLYSQSDTAFTVMQAYSSTFTNAAYKIQGGSAFYGLGVGGVSLAADHASGTVRIYTGAGGTLRATYDAAGNYNFGSTNIMDSPAVPTIAGTTGGTVAIAGRDTAFRVTSTVAGTTAVTVAFNTTYTNPPACVGTYRALAAGFPVTFTISTTTTQATLTFGTAMALAEEFAVLCRGY